MIEIIIPGDFVRALSLNQRLHHFERHRRSQDYKSRAWLAWSQAGRPRATGKVRLDFLVRRGRMTDPGAVIEASKALIDGLTDQPGRPAMLPSDSAAWVEIGSVAFETGKQWLHQEEVVVRVSGSEES